MLMRRRMMRPGVGIVGAAVGTAAVVGTAGAVRHHQEQKWAQQDQAQQAEQQQAYEAGAQAQAQQDAQAYAQPAPAPAPAAAPVEDDPTTAQLKKLADLHSAGVLTDEEFAAAKAKALGI